MTNTCMHCTRLWEVCTHTHSKNPPTSTQNPLAFTHTQAEHNLGLWGLNDNLPKANPYSRTKSPGILPPRNSHTPASKNYRHLSQSPLSVTISCIIRSRGCWLRVIGMTGFWPCLSADCVGRVKRRQIYRTTFGRLAAIVWLIDMSSNCWSFKSVLQICISKIEGVNIGPLHAFF
jgi:hypothetical protein